MTRRGATLAFFALLSSLAACGVPPHSRSAGGVGDLAIKPVAWNAASVPIGKVRAVADTGDVVCVFADDGATVFSSGALVAHDTHVKDWTNGASIYATGGTTRWIVGTDASGHLYRLRAMSTFEDVSARYQLNAKKVRDAAIVGPGKVAFQLDGGELAIADANKMNVFGAHSFTDFAGGGGFAAGVTKDAVELVNITNGLVTHFALPDAKYAALDSKGRLFAATSHAIYAADAVGVLNLIYDANHDGVHGLVASGDRIWFADRAELGAIDADHITMTTDAKIGKATKLEPSPSGDVWVLDEAKLNRFTTGAAASPTAAPPSTWGTTIAPVFARACSSCHQPDGVSGVDLSTESAWRTKRADIQSRVLTSHTMPPEGHPISDADREAIHQWLAQP